MAKNDGFDDLSKTIKELSKKAKDLEKADPVPLEEVLSPKFISKHSRFSDAQDFFDASGFDFDNSEEFDAIPEEDLDEFVRSETPFDSWSEMLSKAVEEWAASKLGL